jgi:hypothetical protein
MDKYKVTNTSQRTEKGARNVFITEAGKLLKPGESCVVNRLDNGTKAQGESGLLHIEQGAFSLAPIFTKEPLPAPQAPTSSAVEASAKAAEEARAMDERIAAAKAEEAKAASIAAEAERAKAEAEEDALAAKAAAEEEVSDSSNSDDEPTVPDGDAPATKPTKRKKRGGRS